MLATFFAVCLSVLVPPVQGKVTISYREPACFYCAGHRGVVVAVADGAPVRAIADGTVTFAGEVAGVIYVVLNFAPNLRLTYGHLRDRFGDTGIQVETGDRITGGQVLGHSTTWVYLGVREGANPRNPLPFLGARRVQLVSPHAPPRRTGVCIASPVGRGMADATR